MICTQNRRANPLDLQQCFFMSSVESTQLSFQCEYFLRVQVTVFHPGVFTCASPRTLLTRITVHHSHISQVLPLSTSEAFDSFRPHPGDGSVCFRKRYVSRSNALFLQVSRHGWMTSHSFDLIAH